MEQAMKKAEWIERGHGAVEVMPPHEQRIARLEREVVELRRRIAALEAREVNDGK